MEYIQAFTSGNIELLIYAGVAMIIVEIPYLMICSIINYYIFRTAVKDAIKQAKNEIKREENERQRMIREDSIK